MTSSYRVPRAAAPIDLFLDSNEGSRPPSGLLDAVDPVAALRRYPNPGPLEAQLADRLGIPPDRVVVTAGGDDAIDRVCRAFLGPSRRLVLPVPCFEMVRRYARLVDAEIVEIPWWGGAFPVDAIRGVDAPAVVVVTSPCNPTGAVVRSETLQRQAEALPDTLILVDLAYAEFADEDLTATALRLDNAVVIRTLSKAWGLAGLRVGYAAGSVAAVERLRAVGPPYAVSSVSLSVASAALQRPGPMREHVRRVRREREVLRDHLEALGASVEASQGNFVFAEVPDPGWVRDALAGLGIAIRIFPGIEGLERAIRVTCPGDEQALDRLMKALSAALAPRALLFDMDGVLVDVSRSYRTAIRQTAAAFGVAVSPADIDREKAAGQANNDWVLTHRLIRRSGVDVGLREVTEAFEQRYQGGLWRAERLLASRSLLQRLAARLPLGVVTGRPRRDAYRTLRLEGIEGLFQVVVTMEDGPAKPDPTPVRIALEALGVERAWMVGDTVDDLRAARRAGVVPIGVGALPEAARGLTDLTELEGLLCAVS